jgi:hypothetical protein
LSDFLAGDGSLAEFLLFSERKTTTLASSASNSATRELRDE